MDKLALIKQKYGYVPNAEPKYNSKPAVDKQNTPIKRAQSQRKDNLCLVSKVSTDRPMQSINTKLISQFCPPLPVKSQDSQPSSAVTRSPLKEVKPIQNQKLKINENIVKSYEKTYDLLKNYRNRIIIDSKTQNNESQKTLIVGQNNKIQKEKQQTADQIDQNQREAKESFVASQVSQRMEKRAFPKRCSPLEGIDLKGSCNVYAEIDNISRLQNKIHQLIGERNIR